MGILESKKKRVGGVACVAGIEGGMENTARCDEGQFPRKIGNLHDPRALKPDG